MKAICHGCVQDPVLSAEIRRDGARGTCSYCGRTRKAWALGDLASRIHGVLQANYRPVHAGPYDNYGTGADGDDAAFTITELAGLDDQDIGEDIRAILSDRYSYSAMRDGESDPYGDDVAYLFKDPDTTELSVNWSEFCAQIRTRSRFFNPVARGMLDAIFGNLTSLTAGRGLPVIRQYGSKRSSARVYRARVATSLMALERILADPARELAAPPHEAARAGRMNGTGISLFYGALDVETCLAEVRAPVGSHVVVSAFRNLRRLRLLDLDRLRSVSVVGSMFDPGFRTAYSLATFLTRLVDELSRPVMPGSEEMDYLPTQAVAEYLAAREDLALDGMLFPSSQVAAGTLNMVLFHAASRTAGKRVPIGSRTSISDVDFRDDDPSGSISVWIHKPPIKRRRRRKGVSSLSDMMDFELLEADVSTEEIDGRGPTLALIEDSLEVFAIKTVTYQTTRSAVVRHFMKPRAMRKF